MRSPYLTHADLKFSPVQAEDFDELIALRNHPSTWVSLTDPLPLSREKQEGWLRSMNTSRDRFYWTVRSDTDRFIGIVRMDEYDPLHRSIRIGADVVPELRGRGYGTRIYEAVVGWCFSQLNAHRIWLMVLDSNERAQARATRNCRGGVRSNSEMTKLTTPKQAVERMIRGMT